MELTCYAPGDPIPGFVWWAYLVAAAQSQPESVERLIASSDACPPELLSRFAQHDTAIVRLAVAANPHTPIRALDGLVGDPVSSVRKALGSQLGLPADAYQTLATWADGVLGYHVPQNVHPEQIREYDAHHLLLRLAANSSIPDTLYERLFARRHHPAYAMALARNRKMTDRVAATMATGHTSRFQLASSPNCRPDTLVYLAGLDEKLMQAAWDNPSCPLELLRQAVDAPAWMSRMRVAYRLDCPVEMLEALAMDELPRVRQAAYRNPNLPVTYLLDAPVAVLLSGTIAAGSLPAVARTSLDRMLALASSWSGSLRDLLQASDLLTV